MTPDRYRRVVEVFLEASQHNGADRARFIEGICREDEDLRKEVEAMLAAEEQSDQFLEQTPDDVAADLVGAHGTSIVGQQLGDYQVIELIGAGGMGEVFLALDTRLGRRAALKILPEEYTLDPVRLRRFEQEARAIAALNHPNIMTIYGIGQAGSRNFLGTEFVEGQTLRAMMVAGPLPVERVLEIAVQAASALAAAHSAGVVHRDIKPENMILRPDGLLKILDFGLAEQPEQPAGSASAYVLPSGSFHNPSGLIVGTPRYMSPEQAQGLAVDARTDVFSLGCVLYEMLAGCSAVPSGRLNDVITAIVRQQPTPLATIRPNCPTALMRIVDCTLERDRNRRYPTAQALLLDLRSVLNESNASSEPKSPRRLTSRMEFLFLAIVLGVGTAFLALQRKQESPAEYSSVPLTSDLGSALCPSFSPDGEHVVFSWDGEKQDNFDIYVKQIGSSLPSRLTTDSRPELSPAWSPDGQNIAFVRLSPPGKADLLLIPSAPNRPERRIAEMTAPNELYSRVRYLSWSPDGQWLVVPDATSANASVGLSLVSVHTGEKRRLTQPPPWNDDLSPALSPDGKHLVFARYTGQLVSDLYVLELAKDLRPVTEPKPLTLYHQQTTSPLWTGDGKSLLFTRYSTRGGPGLWRITLPSQSRPEPVPISADNAVSAALSGRGHRLVYTRETANSNIWGFETAKFPLSRTRDRICKPWITSSRQERTPQFSPNGRQIAFQSTRSGWSEIWIADRDGSHPRQFTDFKAAVAGFPHWSPDGTKIVFHLRQQSEAKLFIQNVQGGRPHRLTEEPTEDYAPSWSHDGKWIYFSSQRSGSEQIWRVPATGGPATQITKRGGWAPTESLDQRYLFYTKSNQNGIWRMSVSGGEEQRVISNIAVAASGSAYALGQQGIYFIASANGGIGQHLAFLHFATGQVRTIAKVPRILELGLTVSPDERILLYSQMDQVNSDLMLVEHFH